MSYIKIVKSGNCTIKINTIDTKNITDKEKNDILNNIYMLFLKNNN